MSHNTHQSVDKTTRTPRRASLAPGVKLDAAEKMARIPVKVEQPDAPLPKPAWIRVRLGDNRRIRRVKDSLRAGRLFSVCEEASCPNLSECFSKGTATFMIMGDICTRRCPFCDVAHGRPLPLDVDEPANLASAIAAAGLNYVVITSVDRDDLRDGGAAHFAACIRAVRAANPGIRVEVLVPDFRGRLEAALEHLGGDPPDVFNHNLETVPRLYRQSRPGADYHWSLNLLLRFKQAQPQSPTKSGLMLGLGETDEEIHEVMRDLREHQVDMLTLGQYLQPSKNHLPVARYVPPEIFTAFADYGKEIGFRHVASGPLVRSSYHADLQAEGLVMHSMETS